MTKAFVSDEINQSLMMPPSLHDWLPEDHLARFVADLTPSLDLTAFYASYEEKDARLFSPPRWVHRNCTYGPFVRHGRRWRSRCRMRDDDARHASCCPKPRRRNTASGSTQQSSLMGSLTREIRTHSHAKRT